MRKYIYIIALSVAGLVHVGCSKFDEMNRDPYAIYDAPAESFVQPILYNTEYNLISRSYNLITNLMQQSVSTNESNTSQTIYNYDISESIGASYWSLYSAISERGINVSIFIHLITSASSMFLQYWKKS